MSFLPDNKAIQEIVQRRLINVDPKVKNTFPEVLKQRSFMWTGFGTDALLAVCFVADDGIGRVLDFQRRNWDPFPGLFTTQAIPAAFRLERSRFRIVRSNQIVNSIGFSIGPDSTLVVVDHTQDINTAEAGRVRYTLPLGYFVSFGSEIVPDNVLSYLDELMAYSVKVWTD